MERLAEELTTVVVHQWQCDHFGHLNARFYAAIFDDATFVFWSRHGLAPGARIVPVTAETRIAFRSEAGAGTVASVRSRVGRVGSKSVGVSLELVESRTDRLLASCEIVEVFFSLDTRQSEGIPPAIRESLEAKARSSGRCSSF
ncbi:MAG: acyl-CoA thioesterase [Methylobacterium mesophilicum]|nr:acyl-CoA thioesterase [Methylobacterium mesophilicum]